MATTIRDVAKRAKVSVKTVSRVLNDEPMVSAETRAQVQKVMTRLGYAPNISARRLARGRAQVIALLFNNVSQTYFDDVLKGCFEAARETDYGVLTYPFNVQNERERVEILQLVASRRVDGFIFTPPCDNIVSLLEEMARLKIPFVRLSPKDHRLPYPHVRIQDYEAAVKMTEFLVGLGHRRIGFIAGASDHSASEYRLAGFRDTLQEHNLAFHPDLVCAGDWTFAAGMKGARTLLASNPRPTAIFASNDDIAAGVMFTAHQLGIRVPGELTVTGFDDVPLAQQVWPSLTTIRQPILEIARKATNLLIEMINGNPVTSVQLVLPTELIARDSASAVSEPKTRVARNGQH